MKKSKYPEPFTPLNKAETKIYNRIWVFVSKYIGSQDVDNFIITMAAQKLNMAAEAMGKISINKDGPVQSFSNGTKQVNPDYTVFKTMSEAAAKDLERAGLTPKMRKDLDILNVKTEKPKDALIGIIGMKKQIERG